MFALSTLVALALAAEPPPADRLPSAAATRTFARVAAALEDLHLDSVNGGLDSRDRRERLKVVTEGLDQLVTDLGVEAAAVAARDEGPSLAGKLVAIGLDRRDRPGAYDALAQVYGDETGTGAATGRESRAGLDMVRIRKEHVREQYRLAWEYRLLVLPALQEVGRGSGHLDGPGIPPVPGGPVTMPPTFEGVRRAGTEASILTLAYAFRHACSDDVRGQDDGQRRGYILTALEQTPSPAALRAVLDCAEWAEWQWAKLKPGKLGPRGDPAGWAAKLADAPAEADREKWRAAAGVVAKGPLSARQRVMLAALQERLPAR